MQSHSQGEMQGGQEVHTWLDKSHPACTHLSEGASSAAVVSHLVSSLQLASIIPAMRIIHAKIVSSMTSSMKFTYEVDDPTTLSAGLGYLTSIHLYLLLWIEKFNEPRARRSEKSSSLWPDIMGVTLHLCQSLRGEWGAFNLRATHKRKPGTPLPYRMLEVAERNLSLCGWEKKYGSLLSNFLSRGCLIHLKFIAESERNLTSGFLWRSSASLDDTTALMSWFIRILVTIIFWNNWHK